MSDSSSDSTSTTSSSHHEGTDSTCRDFARGFCERRFCKYRHPQQQHQQQHDTATMLNFCHDHQNAYCPRPHCRFIHCSADEVEEYKRTGEMSNQILAEATRKNQLPGAAPICNQFKKGVCRRSFCKYRHLTKEQEEHEILELIQTNIQRKTQMGCTINPAAEAQMVLTANNNLRRNGLKYDEYEDLGQPVPKRRFISPQEDIDINPMEQPRSGRPMGFKGYFSGSPPTPILSSQDARTIMLEEENSLLHKEIAQLKRQVSDLTATNEFLLDQNATLRMSNKRNGAVNVPAVTLTNTNAPAQPQQVIRTVTASVATVPVSLATVTTCNPVSGNPVSIAGCPAVSIASPAQLLAPSQQILVTTNPSPQLAIGNGSQAQLAQIAQQNLTNLAQQAPQQLTSQAQQIALATTTQQQLNQLTSTQQLNQQLANQQQQIALANGQQLTSVPQLLAPTQQIELHRTNQINAINTSQTIAMSNATQPMVSYPIMTQSINHALTH